MPSNEGQTRSSVTFESLPRLFKNGSQAKSCRDPAEADLASGPAGCLLHCIQCMVGNLFLPSKVSCPWHQVTQQSWTLPSRQALALCFLPACSGYGAGQRQLQAQSTQLIPKGILAPFSRERPITHSIPSVTPVRTALQIQPQRKEESLGFPFGPGSTEEPISF